MGTGGVGVTHHSVLGGCCGTDVDLTYVSLEVCELKAFEEFCEGLSDS